MKVSILNNQQQQWIDINHHFYTIPEMAAEMNIEQNEIRNYCARNNLQPITKGERAIAFIRRNPHLTIDEIALDLNMSESNISDLCRKHKLEYAKRKRGPKVIF